MEHSQQSVRILTGDRPTGPLHLGHYVGSLLNRLQLQDRYPQAQYVLIADLQGLTDHAEDPARVTRHVDQLMADYLAIGLDPEKTVCCVQSAIPELAELTVYLMNWVTVSRLERNPTVKAEIVQKAFADSVPVGFFCYPVSQAADITGFQADCVPVGGDQLPMIEQTNDIVRRFQYLYGSDCLKTVKPLLGDTPRLMGTDGKNKASKSLGNAIFLNDSTEQVREKVFGMFTDPDHLRVSDPGRIEGNVVFAYLDAFYPNKAELEAWKAHYQKGGLGDVTLKKALFSCLEELLAPIRMRRASSTLEHRRALLREGTQKARLCVQHTVSQVRAVLGLRYF